MHSNSECAQSHYTLIYHTQLLSTKDIIIANQASLIEGLKSRVVYPKMKYRKLPKLHKK